MKSSDHPRNRRGTLISAVSLDYSYYYYKLVPALRARCVAATCSQYFPSSLFCLGTFSTNGMSIQWSPGHP